MKRRSFVRNAVAFPFAWEALSTAAIAQSDSGKPTTVVDTGQDRLHETHSLGFSTILFKVLPRDTNGGLFVIEHKNLGKGGPSLHLHYAQEEYFYVMEGEVLFQLGDQRKVLHAGDSVLGPRNVPHAFIGTGPSPARMLIAFTPAGKMEDYFRLAAVPNGPKMDAEISRKYGVEVLGPPLVLG
jgi:quercetin dioxygenase-like cupin family protein